MKPKPISFPEDHRSHKAIIEWWYFNGNVTDKDGNRYSFMDCLFKADIDNVEIPHLRDLRLKHSDSKSRYVYFAHSVVSDIKKQKNHKNVQSISLASNDSFSDDKLFINYIDPLIIEGYVNNEIAELGKDRFHIKTDSLDLTLTSQKPALLEGGAGHITVCGRDSYYYSLTDMKTSGTIAIDGKKVEVTGKSWMDHQWADVPYNHDKWTWFSLQLNNGIDIMCCEYDSKDKKDSLVDIIDKDGAQFHSRDLVLKPGSDVWNSAQTNAQYPQSWEIDVPEYEAKLRIRSLMSDQEMIFMAINYWEGPIEVSGTVKGKPVKGFGYMELVGYPSDYNYLLTVGKGLVERLKRMLHKKE